MKLSSNDIRFLFVALLFAALVAAIVFVPTKSQNERELEACEKRVEELKKRLREVEVEYDSYFPPDSSTVYNYSPAP